LKKIFALLTSLILLSSCLKTEDPAVGAATTAPPETSATEAQPPSIDDIVAAFPAEAPENASITKEELPQLNPPSGKEPTATLKTNKGDIKLVFYPEYAPKGVENFLTHAKEGYYDGVKFHRLIDNFMIQGGDPLGNGTGGESIYDGEPFELEISKYLYHLRGAISYANSGPDTNGSQFFIVSSYALGAGDKEFFQNITDDPNSSTGLKTQQYIASVMGTGGYPVPIVQSYYDNGGAYYLDGNYTVFGQVAEGMDVVDAIAKLGTGINPASGEQSVPSEDVYIESIEVQNY
jgi:peptidyl-prolyl cis-trans isomerase B (cyclophilin B)